MKKLILLLAIIGLATIFAQSQTLRIDTLITVKGIEKTEFIFKIIPEPEYFTNDSTLRTNCDIFYNIAASSSHSNMLQNFSSNTSNVTGIITTERIVGYLKESIAEKYGITVGKITEL